jgi:hypothetical protein
VEVPVTTTDEPKEDGGADDDTTDDDVAEEETLAEDEGVGVVNVEIIPLLLIGYYQQRK